VDAYSGGIHYPITGSPSSLGTIGAGDYKVYTLAQVAASTQGSGGPSNGMSLANSGQRAYLMLTCTFPYAHAQLLLVNPSGVVTFLPGYIIAPNRSYTTGPEQLLQ
jgi:hypothetical protein